MPTPSTIKDLSTTAASNSPAGSDSIGNPGTIDDYFRAYGAVQRAESLNKVWERWNDTPTYIGAASFSVATDLTARYTIGRRFKATVTAGTVYGTIVNSVFGAVTTVTITTDSGALDSGLSEVQLGPELYAYALLVGKFLGTPSSANLAAALTDETGSGAAVFATSPTLVTPALGTPTSGRLSSCDFGDANLTVALTGGNPRFTFDTNDRFIFDRASNTFNFDVAAATVAVIGATGAYNKVTITAPATGSTLTIADGKTLTASNTLTLTGTDATVMTFPGTSATIARTDAAQTFTGNQTFSGSGTFAGGVGYATGSGGTVTQATSKSTAVTLNKLSGEITMHAAALAGGGIVSFTCNNSTVAATDNVVTQLVSGGVVGDYVIAGICGAGFIVFHLRNNNSSLATLSDAMVIRFTVIKGATA